MAGLEEGRLEEIESELDSLLVLLSYGRLLGFERFKERAGEFLSRDAVQLVAEVRDLRGRLQAVCDVLSDADAFDGVISDELVMRAVRGK